MKLVIYEIKEMSSPERDWAANRCAVMGRIERPDMVIILADEEEPVEEFFNAVGMEVSKKELTDPSEWLEKME